MNVTPYERTRWDKASLDAEDRLNRARLAVDATDDLVRLHPGSPFAARLHQEALRRLHWALAVKEEWGWRPVRPKPTSAPLMERREMDLTKHPRWLVNLVTFLVVAWFSVVMLVALIRMVVA